MTEKKYNKAGDDAISLEIISARVRASYKYVKTKWLIILLIAVLGGVIGIGYAMLRKTEYTAVCSFVLDDESQGSDISQYADLASLAGINLGGGGSGLFSGDNIFNLYTSRLMIEKTFLTTANFGGKDELLIDRYANYNHLRDKWRKNDHIDSISFNGDPAKFNRKQDSIIIALTKLFNKKYLSINKPDKKLSIIYVQFKSTDELFALAFTNKIVENVNNFYVQTKTKKSAETVQILQHQADSVKAQLNSSISGVASDIDATPNANPQQLTLKVPSQRKQIDVQASTAVYAEMIKNLEISKIGLRKEMPLIQLIDSPVLPLDNDKIGKRIGLIAGFILFGFLATIVYALKGQPVKNTAAEE